MTAGAADPPAQPQHVAQPEGPVVALDHEARAGGGGEPLEAAHEAVVGGVGAAGHAADVEHDDRLQADPRAVHELGLDLELDGREPGDVRLLGVEDRVLARMARQPDAEPAGARAEVREALRTAGGLVAELRQLGIARVGGEGRRHAVEAAVVTTEVPEDRVERVERYGEVRPRPLSTDVVRRQPALPEHVDREAQAHAAGRTREDSR